MVKPKTKIKIAPKKKIALAKIKKIKKAPMPKPMKVEGKLIGVISHYFSNIEVGIIKLSAPLNQGDEIRVMGGESTDFNQTIDSMQFDHKEIKKAKKGQSIGFKSKEIVRDGYRVYKV